MHDWTTRTLETVALSEDLKKILPSTDSRLRADRLALEKGDTRKAAADKHALEEKQRAEARKRVGAWVPRYFKVLFFVSIHLNLPQQRDPNDNFDFISLGNYWKEREQRLANKA